MCIHVCVCVCYTQTETVLKIFWISTRSDVISVGSIASDISWMTSRCHNRNKIAFLMFALPVDTLNYWT